MGKKALGDVQEESAVADTPRKPEADSNVITSPSQASSTGESTANGTGSDKENSSPKSSGSKSTKSTKSKKKNYWKSRREAKKASKATAGNVDKGGQIGKAVATNGAADQEDDTTDMKDNDTATDNSKETSGGRQEGVNVKA